MDAVVESATAAAHGAAPPADTWAAKGEDAKTSEPRITTFRTIDADMPTPKNIERKEHQGT
jgi:hypothetical protein